MMRGKSFFLVFLFLFSVSCGFMRDTGKDRVCFESACVDVEVVSTPEAMQKGLMGRTSLPENGGMLFIFPDPGPYPFWMKDTLIPLDMIWMNQDRRIIEIQSNVPPCKADPCESYGPSSSDALYVLEVNAGYCVEKGWKKGDQAEFRLK